MTLESAQISGGPRVFVIRHGETEWSKSGQHTGRTDIPLTDEGRKRAARVRDRLANEGVSLAFSSPLSRAQETAMLAGQSEVILLDDLMEWDYGKYEGRTTADIRKERPGWQLFTDGCPGGESATDVAVRADRVIETIARESVGHEAIAVFSHGHMLRVLGVRWIGLAPENGQFLILDTATVSILAHDARDRSEPVIRQWNAPTS